MQPFFNFVYIFIEFIIFDVIRILALHSSALIISEVRLQLFESFHGILDRLLDIFFFKPFVDK